MIDATIVIPTYRHAALVPYSVKSALDQQGASIEVFIVGDGVEDDTSSRILGSASSTSRRVSETGS
jgi:glycosyltransferase involved in cell wall biosynthesis